MKYIGMALLYASFFGMIAFAVWILESGWPLLALLMTPSWTSTPTDKP